MPSRRISYVGGGARTRRLKLRVRDAKLFAFSPRGGCIASNNEAPALVFAIPRHPVGGPGYERCGVKCTDSSQYARIAIWGDSQESRPGDEIVVSELIREVKARQRRAEVVVLSREPTRTQERYDVTAWNSEVRPPRGLWSAYKRLESCDLLIVAGTGLFGSVRPELCKWTALARPARTPVHMLSLGACLGSRGLSRYLVKRALDAADYVSFRDAHSEATARALGLQRSCPVVPDLAFSLERDAVPRAAKGPLLVGVNPDDSFVESMGFDACVQKHLGFLGWLLAEHYEVRLFHSSPIELRICERLEELLGEEGVLRAGKTLLHPDALRPDEMLSALGRCDIVVAAGFHCILIPALSGIPVVGLSHSTSSRELVERIGQDRYAANIERFGTPHLVDSFCSLRANAEHARDLLKLRILESREAVRLQYDDLYGPVLEA